MQAYQMLDALAEGLDEDDKPMAIRVLRGLMDPRQTGVPLQFMLPFARSVMSHIMPTSDPDGFAESLATFLLANGDDIDACNRLGGDHEAISIVALADRYVRENQSR